MIDSHAHLQLKEFDGDREPVIARAREAGVSTVVTIGIDIETSRRAVALAETHPGLYAAVGLSPQEVKRLNRKDITELEQLAVHSKVVALGETGMDLYWTQETVDSQRQFLKWQLELAAGMDKPVVIHCRKAEKELIPLLSAWVSSLIGRSEYMPGVIHCFSGDMEAARRYLEMGFYISLGAYAGYPSSRKLHPVIAEIPSDRVLVETDSPFLPPQRYRGKRNEPAYIPLTVAILAEIRKVSPEVIAEQTTRNARRLYRLPDTL